MRAIWGALLIAALGFGEARAQAGSTSFEGWSAVCDDIGECSAWTSAGGWARPSYLLLRRSADGQWSAHFGVSTSGSEPKTIALKVVGPGGKAIWTHPLQSAADDQSMRRTTIPAAEVVAFRKTIAQGLSFETYVDGKLVPGQTLSLKGSAAALLWIQDRGPDPRRPVIRRAPVVSQAHLPKATPSENTLCEGPFLSRLSPGKILADTSCRPFADVSQSYTSLQLLDETGRAIPGPEIEDVSEDDSEALAGATYDSRTRTLSAPQDGEYRLGSCGAETEWVWDGTRFRMARQTKMTDCVGVPRGLWPSTRRVRVIDAR